MQTTFSAHQVISPKALRQAHHRIGSSVVVEDDFQVAFHDPEEAPGDSPYETAHHGLLGAAVAVVAGEADLEEAAEDFGLDDPHDEAETDGEPLNADAVWQYLKDIHDIPLLRPEQEIELAKRIEAGDSEALQQFTLS